MTTFFSFEGQTPFCYLLGPSTPAESNGEGDIKRDLESFTVSFPLPFLKQLSDGQGYKT